MAVFLVALVEVLDELRYSEYGNSAAAAVSQFGGQVIAGGRACALLENCPPGSRAVIVRFDSVEMCTRFYHSAQYQKARELRDGAALVRMMVLEDRGG